VGDCVLDLGCGDGRICLAVAERYSTSGLEANGDVNRDEDGVHCFGIDINPDLVEKAKKEAVRKGLDKWITFYQKSFLDSDFDFTFTKLTPVGSTSKPVRFTPTIITMYLLPEALELLKPKLLDYAARIKKDGLSVKIITVLFTFKDWIPKQVSDRIYLYDTGMYN